MIEAITRGLRRAFVGRKQEFVFEKVDPETFSLPKVKRLGIYIHIPFCKTLCPFCPYNKIKYDKKFALPYLTAVLKEIDIYKQRLGDCEISSIYIGGGTPTNLIDEVGCMLQRIREVFNVTGNVCLETSVADIDDQMIAKLKEYGIDSLSVGVQSFNDKYLKLLGRNYTADLIRPALEKVAKARFKSVNVDLMFALQAETIDDLVYDLQEAMSLPIDQITAYPLFTFPYASIGRFLKLKKLKMPHFFTRRKMYNTIYTTLVKNGFTPVSVWGFKRGDAPRYSSVTRDYYIGLGAGAASSFKNLYYFNTFSVDAYCKTLNKSVLPVAFSLSVTDQLAAHYWLYWRLYCMDVSLFDIKKVFGRQAKKITLLMRLCKLLRLCNESDGVITLNERGGFWIHLAQNYFVLNYINKVWTRAMRDPWPKEIKI